MNVWQYGFDNQAFQNHADKKAWFFVYQQQVDGVDLPAGSTPTADVAKSLAMFQVQAMIEA